MIATGLTETFFTYVKVGMFAGLCLAFPVHRGADLDVRRAGPVPA